LESRPEIFKVPTRIACNWRSQFETCVQQKAGCWEAPEQKTGLSKFQATSSRTSAGFLNVLNSPLVTASGTEKNLAAEQIDMIKD
jgi:hypothetical protein